MPGFVRVEMEDRLAIVTIDRPDALNALNASVLRELSMAVEHLSMAQAVGAIILTGAGDKAFVAGADIKEMVGLSALEMRAFSEMGRRLGDAMAGCNKPIIAAVNGYALGGGCELALACDIRIASDRAKLGQPEVNIGIIPGFGGSQRLPRIVGPGWAAELVYTGEMIDAATAERIGLVNRVVPADRLLDEAKALARKILERSPAAIALAKACLRSAMEMPLSAGLDFETAAFGVVGSTRDKAEVDDDLLEDFLERRAAVLAHPAELALDPGDEVVRTLQELDVHEGFFHHHPLLETDGRAIPFRRIRGPYLIVARYSRGADCDNIPRAAVGPFSRACQEALSSTLPLERPPERERGAKRWAISGRRTSSESRLSWRSSIRTSSRPTSTTTRRRSLNSRTCGAS